MEFKVWMEEHAPVNDISDVHKILASADWALNVNDIRLDMLDNAFRNKRHVQFNNGFPISQLSKARQGYTNAVQDMKQSLKKGPLPPVIIQHLPDDTYHLDDGNHRVQIAIQRGDRHIPAFVLT